AGPEPASVSSAEETDETRDARPQTQRIYLSNPALPTRWSQPVPVRQLIQSARTLTSLPQSSSAARLSHAELRPLASAGEEVVLVAGTLDTKGAELRFLRDQIRAAGLAVRLV